MLGLLGLFALMLPMPHPAPAYALPPAREYSLGEASLTQSWLPTRASNRRMPYRAQGVVAVPVGKGPFPIVFVLHNAHGGCPLDTSQQDIVTEQWPCLPAEESRYDIGLSYCVERVGSTRLCGNSTKPERGLCTRLRCCRARTTPLPRGLRLAPAGTDCCQQIGEHAVRQNAYRQDGLQPHWHGWARLWRSVGHAKCACQSGTCTSTPCSSGTQPLIGAVLVPQRTPTWAMWTCP